MKIADGFMLREVAGQWVVVPLGDKVVDISGIVALSESAALLWKRLEAGVESYDELATVLNAEYNIDMQIALEDSKEFVEALRSKGLIGKQ